jgi:hypothetical protein
MRFTYTRSLQLFKDGFWAEYRFDSQKEIWYCSEASEGFWNLNPEYKREMTDDELMWLQLKHGDPC